MDLRIPDFSLVVLVGASGSGKTTFAARHFLPTEVLSSDRCRALVSDDESSLAATADAFDVLRFIAAKRLAARRLTVVDATNLRTEDRRGYLALAREWHAIPVAIVLAPPEETVVARTRARTDREVPVRIVREQARTARRVESALHFERFLHVHVLTSPDASGEVSLVRQPLYADKRGQAGPFDIIGDVHGCIEELRALLDRLGHVETQEGGIGTRRHPLGRRAIFLGDLVDRGPDSPAVLRLAMDMVRAGTALCLPGNHEIRLKRHLDGREVGPTHGLAATLTQLDAMPPAERDAFRREVRAFIDGLVSHFWLDGGRLVVAHAGMKEAMQGRGSNAVRQFAFYGETTGETDAYGLPVRLDWAAAYRGQATVVYGHTPTTVAEWVNKTICIDTGCVFGGRLTALRYPELELVDVPAARAYDTPARPLAPPESDRPTGQQAADALIDIADVTGRKSITTRSLGHVSIGADEAAAALEVMERFAIDPRWLIHLPPTMSPPDTSTRPGLLEHPEDALRYYARAGVGQVIVEEKHMGSRAVAVVARDAAAARRRFGVADGRAGRIWTRTGRPFFADDALEAEVVDWVASAAGTARLWTLLATDWLCLDAEILPWTAKAAALIDEQYRPVGAAALAGLSAAGAVVAEAKARGIEAAALAEVLAQRLANARTYDRAWRRHAPPFGGISHLTMAPFHLLASEGAVHADKDHLWHMDVLGELITGGDGFLRPSAFTVLDTGDPDAPRRAEGEWEELTRVGGEGVVVKPLAFLAHGPKGRLVQPALKVRGPDYLRIIYGPDYDRPQHLERLKSRGLGAKRALAIREFALGLEALHRFVAGEPLRRVHECVFAVLALESEPIDPRL